MKTRRNVLISSLTIAAVLAIPATAAQAERFGRESVYAVPGKTATSQAIHSNVFANRYGRDSVYATQARVTDRSVVVTKAVADVTSRPGRA